MFTCKKNLAGLNLAQLTDFIREMGEKKFRAKQIYHAMYNRRLSDFNDMTDLSLDFRRRLEEFAVIRWPQTASVIKSSLDKTRKFLFKLEDDEYIESVLMDEGDRMTLCVSSQAGCALRCNFCATGSLGFKRNLSAGEIIGQLVTAQKESDKRITNIVLMGMGEPLLNYENTVLALKLFTDGDGLGISSRRITLSTVGVIPGIERMTDDRLPCKLALSLNAPNQKSREKLIPVAKKYPLKELLPALHRYEKSTRHRVTFEYVLIGGINDSVEDARRLKRTLGGFTAKLNLIEYNPFPQMSVGKNNSNKFKQPESGRIEAFRHELERPGLTVMLRKSRGADIAAACGQLCLNKNKSAS
ncbi:23S rRNA (adenine(2503)-C(2))-methyltransferase RlmN [bacterium]|nr:23S rRNA (adenine(2503)-C(2))-methyltransferase RlmN [bacterium]